MKILKSIHLKNYRSFVDETIELNNMTAFVGANESGKSNILEAINHLQKGEQNKKFEDKELNLCFHHSIDNFIQLDYTIILNEYLIPNLNNIEVIITKYGKPKDEIKWSIEIGKISSTNNLVLIKTKTKFIKELKDYMYNDDFINELTNKKWFFSGNSINLSKKPFNQLIHNQIIKILKEQEKTEMLRTIILEEILNNIHLYFWSFKNSNYLSETISLEEYYKNWHTEQFQTVTGIFKIAKDEGAFSFNINYITLKKYILDAEGTPRANLLNDISKCFNTIFDNAWQTYWGNKVKLNLRYEDKNLCFRFDDGKDCPPEYRSDGFKWFITFLINFQSKEKSLSNYILLIDEPGGTLHPKGQKDTLKFLNKLNLKNQVIYTTHQTFLIDKNNPKSIRILDRKKKDRANDFWPTKVFNVENEKKHILRDSLLRESLGFTLTDISPINEYNVLVEGTLDRKIFLLCNRKFKILDLNQVSIIDCGRATNIKNAANQYLQSDLKVFCIYDNDDEGKRAFDDNNYVEKNKICISTKKGYTIEDLIPVGLLDKSFKSTYKKYSSFFNSFVKIQNPFMKNVFNKLLKKCEKGERMDIKHYFEENLYEQVFKHFNEEEFIQFSDILLKVKNAYKL